MGIFHSQRLLFGVHPSALLLRINIICIQTHAQKDWIISARCQLILWGCFTGTCLRMTYIHQRCSHARMSKRLDYNVRAWCRRNSDAQRSEDVSALKSLCDTHQNYLLMCVFKKWQVDTMRRQKFNFGDILNLSAFKFSTQLIIFCVEAYGTFVYLKHYVRKLLLSTPCWAINRCRAVVWLGPTPLGFSLLSST